VIFAPARFTWLNSFPILRSILTRKAHRRRLVLFIDRNRYDHGGEEEWRYKHSLACVIERTGDSERISEWLCHSTPLRQLPLSIAGSLAASEKPVALRPTLASGLLFSTKQLSFLKYNRKYFESL